jgi:putative NADH-flavin reductase
VRILLFGAGGAVGRAIALEAINRNHLVTGASRRGSLIGLSDARMTTVTAEVSDPATVARLAPGHDAIASAIGPAPDEDPERIVSAARALLSGARASGVRRLVVVGGAGTLLLPDGRRLLDTPEFPPPWRPVAEAHGRALAVYREAEAGVDWTVVSPAALLEEGPRTGRFRIGGDELLLGEDGASRISVPDLAAAFVDELETGRHRRKRISVAY